MFGHTMSIASGIKVDVASVKSRTSSKSNKDSPEQTSGTEEAEKEETTAEEPGTSASKGSVAAAKSKASVSASRKSVAASRASMKLSNAELAEAIEIASHTMVVDPTAVDKRKTLAVHPDLESVNSLVLGGLGLLGSIEVDILVYLHVISYLFSIALTPYPAVHTVIVSQHVECTLLLCFLLASREQMVVFLS